MELWTIIFRTFFFYFFIIFVYRLMGKREVGQLGIIDLIVSILIAELMAISIEENDKSIFFTIIPILLLVGLEMFLAFISVKSRIIRTIFAGKPSPIIINGKINFKEMVKQRYSLDDLLLELRQNGIKTIENVEYAFLEPNGKLSIFKYNIFKKQTDYPMPLIVDTQIQKKALSILGKNENWLNQKLIEYNIKKENVFYAFYKGNKIFFIKKSDIK